MSFAKHYKTENDLQSTAAATTAAVVDSVDKQLQINSLLSKKEIIIENFLQQLSSIVDHKDTNENATKSLSMVNCNETNNFDECQEQEFLQDMEKKLASVSILLSNKYGPILKQFLSQKQQQVFSDLYIKIPKSLNLSNENATANISVIYSKSFCDWFDSPCISIQSPNKILLKNVLPKDIYILTLYSMGCVKRLKFDECFSLAVCGKSSTGKTRMIESVIQEAAFSFNQEKGVGRYHGCKHRPILLYHDINISCLYRGVDGAIFRSLSRTESTNVKVHSSVVTLPPLWIMISSNQRINNHTFCNRPKVCGKNEEDNNLNIKSENVAKSFFSAGGGGGSGNNNNNNKNNNVYERYDSQLEIHGAKRELLQESLTAVKMRVLELFVKSQPNLKNNPLPNCVMFTRINLIVGLYQRIVETMKKYSLDDFHSPVLISYVLTALCANFNLYSSVWPQEDTEKVLKSDVVALIISYALNESQQELYFKILDYTTFSSNKSNIGKDNDLISSSSS